MSGTERTWTADAFDAVAVRARDCKVEIEGTEDDDVRLEADHGPDFSLEITGRRSQLGTSMQKGEAKFTLHLPKHKAWAVDLFSGQTQFKAVNIRARLNLMPGKGEIQVENCSGALSVISGKVNIRLKLFSETEIPELPLLAAEWPLINLGDRESWPDWWTGYWDQMGGEFDERILKRFFSQAKNKKRISGINLQAGKGDLQLEDITVSEFIVRCGKGDVKLKGGRVADFDLDLLKGNFECESCMPEGDWNISVNRGDIHLSLPADTRARLDVATRQGDIQSTTPMVRVTRQGPEAWHGGRMVGTMGTNPEGKMPGVHLATLHGDIKIETRRPPGRRDEDQRVGNADSYYTPLSILKALSEGRISVDEAERLLHSLDS